MEQTTAGGIDPNGWEAPQWRAVGAQWRRLFGDFERLGVSFEWHEFGSADSFRWDETFHPGSLELCLNLDGNAEVTCGASSMRLGAQTVGFYRQGQPTLEARRRGGPHQFITVELSPGFLGRHLDPASTSVHPLVRSILGGGTSSGLGTAAPLSFRQRELVGTLRQPPVLEAAQQLWFQAKALELMGEFLFCGPAGSELFCRRQQRLARDRVERVAEILRRDLANPPLLDALGREVGCSPFYLSRTFSKETGMTLPQFIRQLRLDQAAELLRAGHHNVTEAALAVGYQSLSHFSRAFHQRFGCCPGLYPLASVSERRAGNPR